MIDQEYFFATMAVSAEFREKILNPETRLKTALQGYFDGKDNLHFGIDSLDRKIFAEIGEVKTKGEFAREYTRLLEQYRR